MAGLESARMMPPTGIQLGDVFYVTDSAYLAQNHLPVGTKGVVVSLGGHSDFYKDPHFTMRLFANDKLYVAFPTVGHVQPKVPMRFFIEGQQVALLKDLVCSTLTTMPSDHMGVVRRVHSDGLAYVAFKEAEIVCAADMCYLIEDTPPATPALQSITTTTEQVFARHGGVTRSKKAVHMEYVPASALEAIGRRLAVGIERGHKRDNWRQGCGNEEAREATINHLLHHIFDYLENGNTSESNTDAIICNAAFLVEYEKHTPYKGTAQRKEAFNG